MIRYKKLGYIAINVTDVKRSAIFYRDMVCLDQVGEITEDMAFFSSSSDYHNLILNKSHEPGLKRIAFELESTKELERAFEMLEREGYNPIEVDKEERALLKIDKAFRFRDPNGVTFEFYNKMMQRAEPYEPSPVKVLKLDHVVLRVPNFQETLHFFNEVLNFKISDTRHKPDGEMYFAFMRCFPNPYHHSFGISQGDDLRLFHIAFKVKDIDDIGIARNRLTKSDVPVVFGPGRHMASGSIFMYYLDPDGLTLEYTLGMEEFPEENPREPRMLDNTLRTTDLWEGPSDPRIGKVGHVEVNRSEANV
ncbi:VOC family protein [Niallia endozanthoxylica]|uniref:2,3-dihydroxy-p-cumate-3,4-dioxygenase n=1 Tax=Niallia endozanthoxylica TaxID=2036016 RepID=A0A5J5HPQ8_9BACI|nr:VOC family protein [Niallia endozanthoxylica]KAA9022249.1 2,3-dihydroxy-p-cumate-3,4-dioxygenase [Niallia endozanthoxylica]